MSDTKTPKARVKKNILKIIAASLDKVCKMWYNTRRIRRPDGNKKRITPLRFRTFLLLRFHQRPHRQTLQEALNSRNRIRDF